MSKFDKNEAINAIHKIAQLLKFTSQHNVNGSIPLNQHYRLRRCSEEGQCIEFNDTVSRIKIPKIKEIYKDLGFIILENENENKFFFTLSIKKWNPPSWFDNLVEINPNGLQSIEEVKTYLEEELKIRVLRVLRVLRANTERSLNSENIEVANVAVYYFEKGNPDDPGFAMEGIKEKFPELKPSKNRTSISIPLKYVQRTVIKNHPEEEQVPSHEIDLVNAPTVEKQEMEDPKPNFITELVSLMKKYKQIPEPEKLNTAGMIKIPVSEKVITLPMSALKKMDIEKGEIKINAQVLREFLIENFSVDSEH